MPPRADRIIAELHRLRSDFSSPSLGKRRDLLRTLAAHRITRAETLQALHDELQFLVAFPPSRTLERDARRSLGRFHQRTSAMSPMARAALDDTGIAGTASATTIPFEFACWLRRHGERASLTLPDEKTAQRLDPLVRLSMFPAESEAFDSGDYSSLEWLRLASRGLRDPFDWLVPVGPGRADARRRTAFEDAEVSVRWELGNSPFSTTRNRAPVTSTHLRQQFRRVPADPLPWIRAPLTAIRRLRVATARAWADASIAAIGARAREVTPTMDPNLDEVYLADLGEGASLCVLGAHPEKRLALESNYGYVLFSNGVPIGYGGVTPLADQANTGANLFPAFRGSEAAFLFAQALRAFRGLFGISRFVVNPYQFGKGNDEALASGAFWFYDRLGFRSVRRDLRRLADRERLRVQAAPGTRSSLAFLRRLAGADLVLDLSPSPVPRFDEHGLVTVGRLIASSLASVPAGDRVAHATRAWRTGSAAARRGAMLLGPVLSLIERDTARWPAAERRALATLVRAKGGTRERHFARLSREHVAFWAALTAVCRAATNRRGRAGRS